MGDIVSHPTMDAIFSIDLDWEEEPTENKSEDNEDSRDSKIAQLTASMVDLQVKLQNRSPILVKLPPEIICHIFNFTLPDFSVTDYHLLPEKDRAATPFILGAVCQYWRVVVWSTPVLWSSVVIHLSQATLNKRRSTLVKDWLVQSGQLPLSIRIVVGSFHSRSQAVRTDLKFLAGIITSYSSRWCHFEISSISDIEIVSVFRPRNPHAPMLESLRLQTFYNDGFLSGLVTCPRLQRVHISHFPYRTTHKLSWNLVTHLCLQRISLKDVVETLAQTPLLVHAEFARTNGYGYGLSDSQITLPFLKSLKVEGYRLFHCMICPALDELICEGEGDNFHTDYIIPFLAHSDQIRSFSLLKYRSNQNSSVGLISVLQALPFVKKLVIVHVKPSRPSDVAQKIPEILGMIQSSQSNPFEQPRFLPYLETFDYTGLPLNFLDVHLPTITPPDPSSPSYELVQGSLQSITLEFDSVTHLTNNTIFFFMGLMERGVKVDIWVESQNILQSSIDYYKESSQRLDWDFDMGMDFSPDIF